MSNNNANTAIGFTHRVEVAKTDLMITIVKGFHPIVGELKIPRPTAARRCKIH
jgi:hypothetical protein